MCGRYTLTADAESIQLAFNLESVEGWAAPREWLPLMAVPRPEQLEFHEVSTEVLPS
ncbi:MAG: hypothetical protein OXG68_14525 [Chloroflexi bacterium]|nr:hypothetical protein [Chloroflexota bacterium]